MSTKKILIGIAFTVALIVIGKLLYDKLEDYCPRCKNPVGQKEECILFV